MAFRIFPQLPTEIRLEIWRQCLPERVVELDEPASHLIAMDPDHDGYRCVSRHTALINRRPPVISRVCHESRMVALEHVDLLGERVDAPYFGLSMGIEDWVDKTRDVLHLNYDELYDTEYPAGGGDPVRFWLSQADARARDASLTRDLFRTLVQDRKHDDLLRNRSLLVCLRIVTIHAPLHPALESGLFGLLGDARVVLVDATDTERKERYRAFWKEHGPSPDADPYPARFFDYQQNVWVRDELKEHEISWLVYRWRADEDKIAGSELVWKKEPDGDEDWDEAPWTWQHWIPDWEHWWARQTLSAMPKVCPTVMFRLCTQNCAEENVEV